MEQLFFELIRIALGSQKSLDNAPTKEQWRVLYKMTVSQTLVGVLYPAIERLPEEQRPPKDVLLQWYMMKERIVQTNRLLNKRAVETMEYFHKNGFDCCVLKGQGVATLYPNPLLRTSGDIDIWLSGGRKRIYDFARLKFALNGLTYRHIHFPLYKDVEVEIHTTPINLLSPFSNYKLYKYFKAQSNKQFRNFTTLPEQNERICVPCIEFNQLYILLHIYEHFLGEGIGLRQVLDYFYVLRQLTTKESKACTVKMLRKLKMLRFARAMMWVQQEVLGLEAKYLLVEPDEEEGRFLLNEIMLAGNFGKYDVRIDHNVSTNKILRVWKSILHNRRIFLRYPYEMVWDVPFRTYQYIWSSILILKYNKRKNE